MDSCSLADHSSTSPTVVVWQPAVCRHFGCQDSRVVGVCGIGWVLRVNRSTACCLAAAPALRRNAEPPQPTTMCFTRWRRSGVTPIGCVIPAEGERAKSSSLKRREGSMCRAHAQHHWPRTEVRVSASARLTEPTKRTRQLCAGVRSINHIQQLCPTSDSGLYCVSVFASKSLGHKSC